jgi:ribosomal protein S18 acetylase RimI-like enzyme
MEAAVNVITHVDLYSRGMATVLAAFDEYARVTSGARVERNPGVTAAVFPDEPERGFYNNAVLERDLVAAERTGAIEALESAYAAARVTRFAAWVHETDHAMQADLERRGYVLDETTLAMGMPLEDTFPSPDVDIRSGDWVDSLRVFGLPLSLVSGLDRDTFRVLIARVDGEDAAAAVAYDHDGDCGIYNVGTAEWARRRGLGTALTALQLERARERGCQTASLQATAMAVGMYRAVGFRDLGRILEYVPQAR